jgi:lipoate-protein ligase B
MFTLTLNTDTQGVMGVTRGGQVSYHGDSSLPLVIISNYIMLDLCGNARVHIYNWLNERKAYQLKPSTR